MSGKSIIDRETYKNRLVEIFKAFINVCEQHNLKYFCIGGTLIGAIRHNGMIPWDDDIDVVMPRADYDKLLSLSFEDNPTYEIVSMEKNNNYYLPYAKFCDKNSTLLEYTEIPCVLGLFVDVFPLDGAHSDISQRERDYFRYKRLANKLHIQPKQSKENLIGFSNRFLKGQLRTAWYELYYSFNKKRKRNRLLQEFKSITLSYSFDKSAIIGNYGGMWGLKEFWKREWFTEHIMHDFESIQVKIPKHYDNILTHVYGNYMKLPPEDKRVSHHNVAYVNLEKRVTLNVISRDFQKD